MIFFLVTKKIDHWAVIDYSFEKTSITDRYIDLLIRVSAENLITFYLIIRNTHSSKKFSNFLGFSGLLTWLNQ